MGYYTYYTLDVKGIRSALEYQELAEVLDRLQVFQINKEHAQLGRADFWAPDVCKWYDCDADMLYISEQFPHMTFMLDWDGEDKTDFGKIYFQNGQMEYCPADIHYREPTKILWDQIPDIAPPNSSDISPQQDWQQIVDGA